MAQGRDCGLDPSGRGMERRQRGAIELQEYWGSWQVISVVVRGERWPRKEPHSHPGLPPGQGGASTPVPGQAPPAFPLPPLWPADPGEVALARIISSLGPRPGRYLCVWAFFFKASIQSLWTHAWDGLKRHLQIPSWKFL